MRKVRRGYERDWQRSRLYRAERATAFRLVTGYRRKEERLVRALQRHVEPDGTIVYTQAEPKSVVTLVEGERLSPEKVVALFAEICNDTFTKKLAGIDESRFSFPVLPEISWGRGGCAHYKGSSGVNERNEVYTPRFQMQKWASHWFVIVHEIAHWVHACVRRRQIDYDAVRDDTSHGGAYAAIYVMLVREFISLRAAAILWKSMVKEKVTIDGVNLTYRGLDHDPWWPGFQKEIDNRLDEIREESLQIPSCLLEG